MATIVTAKLSFLRMGPRKVRLVADLIRGRSVLRALDMLMLTNKKASRPLLKLLQSAVANAKHNHQLEVEKLRVKTILVDGGPVLKRSMPRAHGRATPIKERTSHIYLALEEIVPKVKNLKNQENNKSITKKTKKPESKKIIKQ